MCEPREDDAGAVEADHRAEEPCPLPPAWGAGNASSIAFRVSSQAIPFRLSWCRTEGTRHSSSWEWFGDAVPNRATAAGAARSASRRARGRAFGQPYCGRPRNCPCGANLVGDQDPRGRFSPGFALSETGNPANLDGGDLSRAPRVSPSTPLRTARVAACRCCDLGVQYSQYA